MSAFDMHELYARDPKTLSDDQFRALVANLRESRTKFVHGERQSSSVKPTKAVIPGLDIKL